jgi:hypothetical protein
MKTKGFALLAALIVLAGGAPAQTTGQGDYTFEVFQTRNLLPAEAQEVLEKAHGGFAVDRRDGKGETYFALPGAGIIRIASDLASAEMVASPEDLKNNNMHNCTIWEGPDGEPYLSFPANELGKVFTTTLTGDLVHTLRAPRDRDDFDEPTVNKYFAEGGKFVPTDTDVLDGRMYITTGYSPLDYVLTAAVGGDAAPELDWHDLAFGGRGDGPGQFGTGHGVTVQPDGKHISVADRPRAEIDHFTRYGHYRGTQMLPEGAFPCDVDYAGDYVLAGCLHGGDRSKGAPIYLLKDGEVISTIMCREDLELEKFTHIHNAVLRIMDDRLYVIAQAWNPGDFVILRQVK